MQNCQDVQNSTVLVRVDFNVPISSEGKVLDDFRIKAAIPTIQQLLEHNNSLALIAHLGRPTPGQLADNESLRSVKDVLEDLLSEKVEFRTDISDNSPSAQRIILYENLRNWSGEADNDVEFAKQLAKLGEVFVQDAFGVAHRKVASTDAIAKLLPSYRGLLLEKEVTTLTQVIDDPATPFAAIIGGAKIADKIDMIERFIAKADLLVVGGAMANTFLQDSSFGGLEIGASVFEEGEESTLAAIKKRLSKQKTQLVLPDQDVAVGIGVNDTHRREVAVNHVAHNDLILDFGHRSIEKTKQRLATAKTVIWNGPLGYIENPAYAKGSIEVAQFLANLDAEVIVGGGDTAEFVNNAGLAHKFSHVSTGGGASLELLSGKKLPAVEALRQ